MTASRRNVCEMALIGMGLLLSACATTRDVESASQQSLQKTEEVRSTLSGKIDELDKIQRDATRLLEQTKNELRLAQKQNAELTVKVQEIKGQDLSAFQGQLEGARRDLDGMQSALDDHKAQEFALNKKLSGKLEEQTARMGGLEKRAEAADQTLAQMSEGIKGIATKLSEQVDQNSASLTTLTAQVAQLQGALGELTKAFQGLNDRVMEVDRRITELAGKTDGKAAVVPTPESIPAERREAGDVVSTPSEPDESKAATVPAEPAPPVKSASAQELYDRAQAEYKKGRYEAALGAFRLLVERYPQSTLASNAHFWMAECYVKTRDFSRGLEEYEQVITRYPKSGKASAALYRKAITHLELKDREAAKTALRQLITDYPQSEDYQRAREKLASLK